MSQNSSKNEIVEKIVEHADLKLKFGLLLNWAKENNPDRFKEHGPYWEGEDEDKVSSRSSDVNEDKKWAEVKSGRISRWAKYFR